MKKFEKATTFERKGKLAPPPKNEEVWMNDKYQVNLRIAGKMENGDLIHLSIKRRDKEAIHDWRDFQEIKNMLCGKETCALEIYPPESKLVDTANQYHLWVFDSGDYFPFMFQMRVVSEDESIGNKQRPFEIKPPDLVSPERMKELVEKYKKELE
ncbi:MAG: hypothetical protein KG003_08085 [Bacteroidetes bacterium]|nr:hypothetical protein [Bacteroidota bacterium]